ncbi:MAG: hypothetical protein HN796_04305 [Gemmatimonadetes bacterium]|jgi:hypothetical protein|nr:hypothetical protein [Gemmatimonadota bacterium]
MRVIFKRPFYCEAGRFEHKEEVELPDSYAEEGKLPRDVEIVKGPRTDKQATADKKAAEKAAKAKSK